MKTTTSSALIALCFIFGACSDDTVTADATIIGDGGKDAGADVTSAEGGVDAAAALALGEFVDIEADKTGLIKGSVPVAADHKFLAILISRDNTPVAQTDYKVGVDRGMRQEAARPKDARGPRSSNPAKSERQCRFAERLDALLKSADGRRLVEPKPYRTATTPPKVGDKRTFSIRDGGLFVTITAKAIRVDTTAVFWIDETTQPAATIDAKDLKALGEGFTNIIVPRERIYFGKESDVDGDTLISVLLSPLVAKSSVAYVSPCDLVDPKTVPGCAASNNAELVYLSPPSSLKPPYNTANAMLETVAHEFQHAIYFHRKYRLNNNVTGKENPYITEGLSALAQDLSGYQAGNLYVVQETLNKIDLVSLPNTVDIKIDAYVPGADGVMRGAGYLVLRYLFDQAGGDSMDAKGAPVDKGGIAWLRKFVDQKETGTASAVKAAGGDFAAWSTNFWTAIALSNRVSGGKAVSKDAKFNFLGTSVDPVTGRQRGTDLFGATHAGPITGPALQEFDKADGKLRAGGAELLTLSGKSKLEINITTDPVAKAILRVVRIR